MKYLLILLFLPSCVTIYVTEPKKGSWSLSGSGTTAGVNFAATTDTASFIIKPYNVKSFNGKSHISDDNCGSGTVFLKDAPKFNATPAIISATPILEMPSIDWVKICDTCSASGAQTFPFNTKNSK